MKINITRSFLIAAAVFCLVSFGYSQTVEERNVRAAMTFLASDAMQGRGSGTTFERIAAEYIGSQFMQFGLEPAGEKGFDGKPTYVQTVDVPGRTYVQDIKFSAPLESVAFGKHLAVFGIFSKDITGPLQRARVGDAAKKGAVVLLTLGEDEKWNEVQPKVSQMAAGGAAAVIVIENNELHSHWGEIAGRRAPLSRRGINQFLLSKDGLDAWASVADGTAITMTATTAEGPKTHTWNAMGKITGSDQTLGAQVILLTSHLDHVGVRDNAPGDDKIFNGADDDASGSVAVLELARVLGAGKRPKRTVYFVCFGSEEAGGYGARYFVENMPFPKETLVANLEFEMIGRPDAKVKAEELWLTGYERSNLGPELARRGAKLVQDPHPEENFFQRSDNIQLARAGIIAHTVSSFGLHTDYHKASDEVKTIDFGHMTKSINSMIKPIDWLVNSDFRPSWVEGKRP